MSLIVHKLLPILLCLGGCGWGLAAYFAEAMLAGFAAAGGFLGGYCGGVLLLALAPATGVFAGLRLLLTLMFVTLGAVTVRALLLPGPDRAPRAPLAWAALSGSLAGVMAGGLLADTALVSVVGVGLVGLFAPLVGALLGRRLAARLPLVGSSALLLGGGLILLLAAHAPRLDLFAPLAMKVMKFTHDTAHQLFETLLLPDHPFLRSEIWDFIGFFFSTSVGNWVGGGIWLLPPLLGTVAIALRPLPSVAELRSGPERRLVLAGQRADRRRLLRAPLLASLLFVAALWRSLAPVTDYWDPPPVAVIADSSGRIVIPRATGAYDLGDGRLRKFVFSQQGTKVRFFLLLKPDGTLVGTLDACAICAPDGYGQGEGSVICYYCRTLIPLETVGATGGCNPVPIAIKANQEQVVIESGALLGSWQAAIQPQKSLPRQGRSR